MKLTRSASNPILLPSSNTWENRAVFNPGVFFYQNDIHLLYRAQGQDGISRLGLARLDQSGNVIERKPDPIFSPDPDSEYETKGVEDPRISSLDGHYYLVYVAASPYPGILPQPVHQKEYQWRVRVSLAKTSDFESWNRFGVIIGHIDSKDAALFPQKIDGNFLLIHRVIPHLRLAVAPDGRNFKERGPLFGPRAGMWDSWRVGTGAPPLLSPYGWLMFYHGVDEKSVYRLGLALLDVHDPSVVLARTPEPILEPSTSWETAGQVPNVVFSCGAIETESEYQVYYGGADTVIGLATIPKAQVWNWAKQESEKVHSAFEVVGQITAD